MIRRHYAFPFSRIIGVLLGLYVGFGGGPVHAQLDEPLGVPSRPDADVGVSLTLRGHTIASERGLEEQKRDDPPHLGRALVGSTIGVGLGGGFGVLLLKGADEANSENDAYGNDEEASEAAATMALIGVAAMVAGGPIGAVRGGGIEHNRRNAYVGAGTGELVVGLLGYGLARQVGDGPPSRLAGLGAGMAVGSAVGAVWSASAQEKGDSGLLSYRDGHWRIAKPDVRIQPHLTTNRLSAVGVTLLSARL